MLCLLTFFFCSCFLPWNVRNSCTKIPEIDTNPRQNRLNNSFSPRFTNFAIICALFTSLVGSDYARSQQTDEFAAADAYALSIPKSEASTVDHLAAVLAKGAKNDREKARIIYRWIAKNISYDTHAFFSGDFGDMSAKSVLKTMTGICDGYAQLFVALATSTGLHAERIGGNSKGYGYVVGSKIEGPKNHAWNAVQIDGVWRLVDCTWGAGYIDEKKNFVERFSDYFFLTPPDQFIYDHLPDNPEQQFLSPPVSKESYENLVNVQPLFFRYGLQLKSHREGIIRTSGRVDVVIGALANIQLLVQLLKDGRRLDPSLTYVYRNSNEATLCAVFPETGTYIFRLFAKQRGDQSRSLEKALDYQINVIAPMQTPVSFPVLYEAFDGYALKLVSPAERETRVDRRIHVELNSPGDVRMIASLDRRGERLPDTYTFVQSENGSHNIQVIFPRPGQYVLTIYAKRTPEAGDYNAVLSCAFNSVALNDPDSGFPKVYELYRERNAFLLSPMEGHLKANKPLLFKIRVPDAEAVSIVSNGKWLALNKNGEIFEGSALMGQGKAEVFARFPGSKQFFGLLAYDCYK